MYRNLTRFLREPYAHPLTSILLRMKLTFFICLATLMQVSASIHAQKVTLKVSNEPIESVFARLREQTGYDILYRSADLKKVAPVNLNVRDMPLKQVIEKCLSGQSLTYSISGNTVIIKSVPIINSRADSLFKIKGRVFDSSEPPIPIPGVIVKIKDKPVSATTDPNGNFEISVNQGDILLFSYVGFKNQEYTIRNLKENLTISLAADINALDEVVVTGYTERKLKHLANSMGLVDIKATIQDKPITQLSQALQGGVTGLTVQQASGLPGGDAARILIRGISTLGVSDPLILVDGVPYPLDDIDPTTVESISVLKDAAAASIYGSRAANGVIVVTTKRGKVGKVSIVYDGYAGIQRPTYIPEFVEAPQYMEMVNLAQRNNGGTPTYTQSQIDITRAGTDPLVYPNTNWSGLVLKDQANSQSHTIGISGGNNLARFAVTGSYLKQDGIIASTSFNRYNLRANTSITLSDKLSMYLDLALVRRESERPVQRIGNLAAGAGGAGYILYETYRIPPNIVGKYPARADGYQAYGIYGEMLNPIAELERGGYTLSKDDDININFQPQWDIIPGLKLRGQYLFRTFSTGSVTNRDAYNFLDYFSNALRYQFGSIKTTGLAKRNYQYMSATLDYNKIIGKHTVYALAGLSREMDNPSTSNQFAEANLASFFLKLNYIYNDKYLFESTVRTDGSSKFGPGKKWGVFPSAAIGWNINKEEFLKNFKTLSNLKVRASYGLLGNNQNVGLYQYQTTINAGTGREAVIGNPDITWETVKMLDIGLDASFLDNKIGLTVDYFDKKTEDILLTPPLSLSSGLGSSIPVNAGSVSNKGWEVAVNYNYQIGKQVKGSVSAGYSYYENKILSLTKGPYINGSQIQKEGFPLNSYYGYMSSGLLQQSDIAAGVPIIAGQVAGDIRYLDLNGDNQITSSDRTVIGNPNPKGNYFLNLRLDFKRFDLQAQLNGFTKTDAYYTGRYNAPLNFTDGGGTPMTWQSDTWTPTNTGASLPRLTPSPGNNALASDYWQTNAAFARVRFMQLGYTFSEKLVKKARLSQVRLYFNAQNPFTFTDMKYLDPETRGADTTYPMMRFYTFGINVKI
jgi:TonB-linked SusC/RagA family outer membrane protein